MKRRLSIFLAMVFLFTAVLSASMGAVYASNDEDRLGGQNRYETAYKIAKAKYTNAETVIIVRGDGPNDKPNVVDGLTASVLAGAVDAPILLTEYGKLPQETKDAIEDLKAEKAYIVGGVGAVSDDVKAELEAMGLEVKRVEGEDRFETAVAVAKEANTGAKTAIVTNYIALVDSLVAGSIACLNKYPILLVYPDKVGDATAQAIKDLDIENVIIVGGTGVISEAVEDELDELVSGSVTRLGGKDRYLTSVAVAQKFENVKEVALVNGESFVDAVAASILGMPILYVRKDSMISEVEGFISSKASGVKVIGGTGVISDELANKAANSIKFVVTSVSADNLKEIVVSFSQALNKDTVVKANFKLNGNALADNDSVALNPDGKSVTITLANALTNATSYKLTVSGVKSASGISIAETTVDFLAFDIIFPTALKVEQIGPSTIKVTFSEPIQTVDYTNFKVNDGEYFIDGSSVALVDGNKAVTFNLYTTLEKGKTYTVTVSGVTDYANLTMIKPVTLSFVGIKDEQKPVVTGVVKATPEEVVLQFSENITLDTTDWSKFYHSNSKNIADEASVVNGNQLKIKFTTYKLPSGVAYLYIAKDVVKDGWGNKNDEIKAYSVVVTVDNIKPAVKEVKAVSDKKIEITFTEDIANGAAGVYTILDSTGAKVTNPAFTVTQPAGDKVELSFASALPGSTYTVVVEKVKDLAGNEIEKTSRTVVVVDTTAPVVETTAYLYPAKKIVKIMFNEPIKAADLLNLANYIYNGKYLTQYKDVTATVVDGGKAVLLDFSKDSAVSLTDGATIVVGKVHDLAGNPTEALSTVVTLADQSVRGIEIEKAVAVDTKTVKVTLKDTLAKFDSNDFVIKDESGATVTVASVTFANVDGKGVITYTLANELSTEAKLGGNAIVVITKDATASENAYGIKVKANHDPVEVEDGIAPKIAAASFTTSTRIDIQFTEAVKADTVSKYTFTVTGNTVVSASLSADGKTLTLTLKDAVSSGTKVTVEQVLSIEDIHGNVATGLKKEVTKE